MESSTERKHDIARKPGIVVPRDRSWTERFAFEVGSCYVVGLVSGGAIGFVLGASKKPAVAGAGFRLRFNSAVNQSSKWGGTFANTGGVFAVLYNAGRMGSKRYLGADELNAETGGVATAGFVGSLPRGPAFAVVMGAACAGMGAAHALWKRRAAAAAAGGAAGGGGLTLPLASLSAMAASPAGTLIPPSKT